MGISKLIRLRRGPSIPESERLANRISEAKERLLAGIAKIRAEQKLIELEVGKRRREALRQRETDEPNRYHTSLRRWRQASLRVERLDKAIDFMERNVDLLEDASLGVKIGEVTALTGNLLSDLNLISPDIKSKMEDFEVDFVNLTGNVKELLDGVQPPGYDDVPETIQEVEDLEQMLLVETSEATVKETEYE